MKLLLILFLVHLVVVAIHRHQKQHTIICMDNGTKQHCKASNGTAACFAMKMNGVLVRQGCWNDLSAVALAFHECTPECKMNGNDEFQMCCCTRSKCNYQKKIKTV